ncbi:hypothetical protein KC360_g8830 [Hortaea werneckii]|nr:hypothetical protein KC325_g8959 [Hortaea werneckii]KAI6985908.1 hypothetical protein KC359_g8976 [Hortaea werneckii]KAI7140248.1 hypothetical protein KC344_g8851 [Hortaea werneckii]KAI7167120.1 hypothetical protein KC360_g8830 [Hortaea werneckii]
MAHESTAAVNYPVAKACEVPYRPAHKQNNPVVKGLPLYYGAKILASCGPLQDLLWSNAGFASLRGLPELDNVDPRYEPTVIRNPSSAASEPPRRVDGRVEGDVSLLEEDWTLRRPQRSPYLSALDYHEAYKSGKLTPTTVLESLLPLITRETSPDGSQRPVSHHATAFLQTREDLARKAAEASTARYASGKPLSPLDGVPIAVKDEEDVGGYKKHLGSKIDFTSREDATSYCVARWLEDGGAVMVGKTNMHELGMDTTNNNQTYGTPLNPHNDRYYTGGSSGGSAYAVSAGLVPLAIGNDGGGSIRIPSAYCGVYGLKPSSGRVSIRPTANLAKSTAVAGPIAANMADLEIGYRIMAQPDPLDRDSKHFPPPRPQTVVESETRGRPKYLGVYDEWIASADGPVKEACQAAIDYLTTELGYTIVPIALPLVHAGQLAHAMTIMSEAISGLKPSDMALLSPANQVLLSVGSRTPATDFLQAQKLRNVLMQHLSHLFRQYPGLIILTPTTPNAGWSFHPSELTHGSTDANMQIRNMEYVWLANFTGCPAISVPVGYVAPPQGEEGRGGGRVPVGMMGMGEWGSEDELVGFGYGCERFLRERYEGGRARPGRFYREGFFG